MRHYNIISLRTSKGPIRQTEAALCMFQPGHAALGVNVYVIGAIAHPEGTGGGVRFQLPGTRPAPRHTRLHHQYERQQHP